MRLAFYASRYAATKPEWPCDNKQRVITIGCQTELADRGLLVWFSWNGISYTYSRTILCRLVESVLR